MGRGCPPSPFGRGLGNLGTFSLEMAHFGTNFVVYFNRNVRLFTARTTAVTAYCWRLTGPPTEEGSQPPPRKILRFFHLKWLILVQIQLYFNRNVRQFLLGPQQLLYTCTAGGWGVGVRSSQSNSPR